MQKRIKQYLGWMIILESVLGVLVITAFITLYTIQDKDLEFLKWVLDFSIVASIVAMVLSLLFMSMWLNHYVVRSLDEMDLAKNQSDRLNWEIISNITHDLKTPLTAIKGYAQGILDGVAATPDRLNKYVLTIRNKADDMAGLVDELSFFSHIYQNNFEYHWQYVNAVDYFSECISQLSLDLEMKNINLIYRFDITPSLTIQLDGEKLRRVINNIIGNAVKYIQKENGLVFVHIEESSEELVIHVTDNGVGIERQELARIFERFYRTDNSRNSKTGGTGLGLAIAKKIVEDHNGKIWAESELDRGTRISFSLPKELQTGELRQNIRIME